MLPKYGLLMDQQPQQSLLKHQLTTKAYTQKERNLISRLYPTYQGGEPMCPTSLETDLNTCVSKSSNKLGKKCKNKAKRYYSWFSIKNIIHNKEDKSFPNCFPGNHMKKSDYTNSRMKKRLTVLIWLEACS